MTPTINKIDGGWHLSLDDFPIALLRSEAGAVALSTILEKLRPEFVPDWTPSDLCILYGFTAGQAVGPMRNKRISFAWGPSITRAWHARLSGATDYEINCSPAQFMRALAGQTNVDLPISSILSSE